MSYPRFPRYRRFAKGLTPRRLEVHRVLTQFEAQHSYPPTVRELGAALNLAVSTTYTHLENLEREGLVRHTPNTVRGWSSVSAPRAA